MKISNLYIGVTDISDALSMEQNAMVGEILSLSKQVIQQGGVVTLEYRYINAPSETVVVFKTVADLDSWKDKINQGQVALNRSTV